MTDVFIVSAVRTAIGTFGGSLMNHAPTELGALVTREAIARSGLSAEQVGHVVFGQVIPTEPKDCLLYTSRCV